MSLLAYLYAIRLIIIQRIRALRAAPWLPRYEGAGKLPTLGNLTEGVYHHKKYTPPVSFADIPLKTRGTRAAAPPCNIAKLNSYLLFKS